MLKMNGLIIKDSKIIESMDVEFNSEKNGVSFESNVINLKKDKNDKYTKMPIVSDADFQKLREHMKKALKDIGNEIVSGNVKNEPLYRGAGVSNPCDYCVHRKVCMFDISLGNRYRRMNELKDDDVIKRIREE